MTMDYQSNSKRDKKEPKPEKHIERVIKSEVLVQKKTMGRKFKDLFIEADFKNVSQYVIFEVMIPAAKNLIVDASIEAIRRTMYGDNALRARRFGPGPRVTYNRPVNRSYSSPYSEVQRPSATPIPVRSQRTTINDLVFQTREEAAIVLERMVDVVDTYDVVSVSDLKELVGLDSSPVDNLWGWTYLDNVQIRQVRDGFILDLHPAEPIQ